MNRPRSKTRRLRLAAPRGRRAPAGRHHVYLVPGFFGFTNLGRIRYFTHVREYLLERATVLGLEVSVQVVKTHPTASLPRRAARLLETIVASADRNGGPIHLVGHSSGGLDIRLATAAGVVLPMAVDAGEVLRRVRSVVTVATPHYGTPVASFFTGLLGQKVLRVLSLSTIYVLRFGRLPLWALLQSGAVFARLDNLWMNSVLLDQLFDSLLADFSVRRRQAVRRLFAEIARDQGLLLQLTPEGMDLFNATVRDNDAIRYGSVVAEASQPGFRSVWNAGLDPAAQAMLVVYRGLYRLTADTPRARVPRLDPHQSAVLRRAYARLPGAKANDGIVPTRSQVWGQVLHAARADHLDVVGHFGDPAHVPPHFDWLTTGSSFTRRKFEALWDDVLGFLTAGAD